MGAPATPRWAVDEMLGRLARYLRFLGHDAIYLRGRSDAEIVGALRGGDRVLLTRDRELATRLPHTLRIRSPQIGEQLRQVRDAFPSYSYSVTFDRCPECNDRLEAWRPDPGAPWPDGLPKARAEAGLDIFQCRSCARRFWDGSHTAQIRAKVDEWLRGPHD